MSHLSPQVFFSWSRGDEVKYESLALSCQDKVHNSVPDPDLEIRWDRSSRLLDKGAGVKNFSALRASFWSKNKGDPPLDQALQLFAFFAKCNT